MNKQFNEKKRHSITSIQTKIILWAGIGFFLSAAFIIGYAALTLRNEATRSAEGKALDVAHAQAAEIQTVLERTLSAGQIFTQSVNVVKTENVQLSRDQVNAMLRQVLIENPQFVGVDVLFEPNAFDGKDAEFINAQGSDANGRFLPYWTRGEGGRIQVELLQDYDISDWYQCPKTTKVPCLIDPYLYPVQGEDVWMTSLVIPFIYEDAFLGITGIDTPVTFLQELANQVDIFNGEGKVVIISNNGTLLGVTGQPELIGQPATALHKHFSTEDYQAIKNGEEILRYDPEQQQLEVYVPIQVGETADPWSVNVIVPSAAILAEASKQMWRMVGIGGGLLIVSLIALSYAARQIAQPIRKITDAALQVADGNLDVVADVQSTDETGILANAFNQMTTQLRTLFGTLEQRVADRTKALATSAEVSRRLSTILNQRELVIEVVEQVKEAFGYYHAHIYLYNDAKDELVMAGGTGDVGAAMLAEGHKVPKGRGLVGRAAESNATVLVPDTTQDPDWLPNPLLPDTKSEVAIPISIGDQVLGVLDVQHDVKDGLSQEDVDALQSIANQVAVAIQNIDQYEKTQKVAADLGVVANVGIATSTITEGERLLQEVVDLSKHSFKLYHAHIYLLNETGDTLELASGAGEVGRKMVASGHAIPLNSEKSLVARAARMQEGVVVNDVQADPDFLPNPLLPETRAEMAVPMLVSGKVIGVLDVQSEQVNRFTDIDVNIQTTLASQVAVALQNARSFANAQKQAERESRLNLIAQKIQGTATIEEAMQIAARELGHALGQRQTLVALDPSTMAGDGKGVVTE
jgi:GAF domain-containing protein/HAMP domain-containing protein